MVLDAVSNFVRGRVSAAVATSDTTVSVEDASIFPDPATDGEYNVVIWDANNFPRPDQDSDVEIVRVTARDTDADELTVERGQETTSDVAHPEGSAVHLSPTAKMFSDIEAEYTAQGENFDGQGTSEFSNLQSVSTDDAVIGVDPANGPSAVEQAVDNLPTGGGTVHIRRGHGTWDDRALISRDNVTVHISEGCEITVDDGSWTTFEIDANPDIPDYKSVIIFDSAENVAVSGSGTIDCDGFEWDEETDPNPAAGVHMHNCNDHLVSGVTVKNIFPDSASGGSANSDSDGRPMRWQGVLLTKPTDGTVKNTTVDTVQYEGIGLRLAVDGARIVNNTLRNSSIHGVQPSANYGGVEADDPDDRFAEGVVIERNSARDCLKGYTTHATDTRIRGNFTRDCDSGVDVRNGGDGTIVENNVLIAPDDGGDWAIGNDRSGFTPEVYVRFNSVVGSWTENYNNIPRHDVIAVGNNDGDFDKNSSQISFPGTESDLTLNVDDPVIVPFSRSEFDGLEGVETDDNGIEARNTGRYEIELNLGIRDVEGLDILINVENGPQRRWGYRDQSNGQIAETWSTVVEVDNRNSLIDVELIARQSDAELRADSERTYMTVTYLGR